MFNILSGVYKLNRKRAETPPVGTLAITGAIDAYTFVTK